MGKPLNVRQQTLATAQAYVRRYYTRIDPRRTNLYLIMATALYVASKIEESPQHIRSIAAEASNQWQGEHPFPPRRRRRSLQTDSKARLAMSRRVEV